MGIPTATVNKRCIVDTRRSNFIRCGTQEAESAVERVRREMQQMSKGRHKHTANQGNFKFTKADAEEMTRLVNEGELVHHVAEQFATSSWTVKAAIRRLKYGEYG